MKRINWGIIGAGRISAIFAEAIKGTEGAQLIAVASRTLDKAKEFAKEYHGEKAYGSYEELVLDEQVDVVYIGTPHPEHKKNAELCLKHGKAVLCEKPITLNEKDTAFLIQLARENGVFFMEAMWTKCLPVTRKVKSWIQSEKLGKIKYMDICFGGYREFDPKDRFFNPMLGGGALLDVGIYPITYGIHMMDELPVEINSKSIMSQTGVDEVNSVLVQFSNGVIGNLSSAIGAEMGKHAIIIGEKGKIYVKDFWMAQEAYIYANDGTLLEEYREDFIVNGYEYEIMEVNQCLREQRLESDLVSLDSTRHIMRILDTIRKQWNFVYPQEQ